MKNQNFTENQEDVTKTHGEFINEGISPSIAVEISVNQPCGDDFISSQH